MSSKLKLITFDAVNTILKVSPDSVFQYTMAAMDCGVDVSEDKLRLSYE